MDSATSASTGRTDWPPAFGGGLRTLLAFALAFAVWVTVTNTAMRVLVGPDPSVIVESVGNVLSGTVQLALVLGVLRYEGVPLRDIGFGRAQLRPALLITAGFVVAVNLVVAGLILLSGGTLSPTPFALYQSSPPGYSLAAIAASGVAQYLFVGPVEELAFRGYVQNKLEGLGGWSSRRVRTAVAVVGTAAGFAVLHVPALVLVQGTSPGTAAGALVLLTLSGIAFGTLYVFTRNLVLVALLHGIGNFWPLFVDPGISAWPNWGVILVLYALAAVAYRRVVPRSERGAGTPAPDV